MSEDAVKVAVHRLRRRFGELLREEIAETVGDPSEVDDEIRYLLGALRADRAHERTRPCRRCGALVRSQSDGSLCPACLMELGLRSWLASGTRLGPYEILR